MQGAKHGTIIYADRQTGGRGRAGRVFVSPVGGLYFSIILRLQLDVINVPLITLAAGVGLCAGLALSGCAKVWLKWPNDLYLNDRKLGGILTESSPFLPGAGPEFVVVGAGINVKSLPDQFPASLRGSVSSLEHEDDFALEVEELLSPLVVSMLSAMDRLADNREQILAQWRARDYLLNRELSYKGTRGLSRAIGIGLASDGRYVVRDRNGVEHRIVAGDINPLRLILP